jgi:hypothetical protein
MEDFPFVEGFHQEIITTHVQDFRPEAVVCQAINHDQGRRGFGLSGFVEDIRPAMAVGQTAL